MNSYVEQVVTRRHFLCRSAPYCPECSTPQVQLLPTYVTEKPAQWKCRRCNHRFTYEPPEDV